MQYGRNMRTYRSVLVYIVIIFLILFWAVPILAVQGIANLDKLAAIKIGSKAVFASIVNWIKTYPNLYAIISGLLPSLVLIMFNAFLPDIIRALQVRRVLQTARHRDTQQHVLTHYRLESAAIPPAQRPGPGVSNCALHVPGAQHALRVGHRWRRLSGTLHALLFVSVMFWVSRRRNE